MRTVCWRLPDRKAKSGTNLCRKTIRSRGGRTSPRLELFWDGSRRSILKQAWGCRSSTSKKRFMKSGPRRSPLPTRKPSDANIFFGNLASDQVFHLFTLLGGFQRELDTHAEAGMCHLHDALHAQLHGKSANDDLDGSTRRKRLRRFHVAAAGTDVAKHTAIRHGASLAENICSETAGMAGLHAPIRGGIEQSNGSCTAFCRRGRRLLR